MKWREPAIVAFSLQPIVGSCTTTDWSWVVAPVLCECPPHLPDKDVDILRSIWKHCDLYLQQLFIMLYSVEIFIGLVIILLIELMQMCNYFQCMQKMVAATTWNCFLVCTKHRVLLPKNAVDCMFASIASLLEWVKVDIRLILCQWSLSSHVGKWPVLLWRFSHFPPNL